MHPRNVAYAKISTFVHVTEDQVKVESAVLKILKIDEADKIEFVKTMMDGHYGNTILELKTRILDRKDVYEILLGILSRLSPLDKALLDGELAKHLDDKNRLYLRFDKQQALLGKAVLTFEDSINIVFRLDSRPKSLMELEVSLESKDN